MKIHKFKMIVGAVGAILMATAVANANDTLKVGMDPLYEPFSYQTPDGKLTGFDFEISNALCDAIDVTCDIQAVPYDGSIAALQSGQIDALINTYAMTKERLEKYNMVGPYIRPSYRLIVSANSQLDGSQAAMKGKTIGLEKTSNPRYPNEVLAKFATLAWYDQISEAILDLNAGRVDAVFGDENQLYYAYVKKDPKAYKLVGESIRSTEYYGEGQGFMLRKGDDKWAAKLKIALDKIIKSGKYDEISQKYFGRNILAN